MSAPDVDPERLWPLRLRDPQRVRDLLSPPSTDPRVAVLSAYLDWRAGAYPAALAALERAQHTLVPFHPRWLARALNIRGAVMLNTGQPAAALASFEQQLDLAQAVGDVEMEGLAHNDIGVMLVWADPVRAGQRYQMAYDCFQAAGPGHDANLGLSAFNLSVAAREQGDRRRSEALLQHAEALIRGAQAWPYWVGVIAQRGLRLAESGRGDEAVALFAQAAREHPDLPRDSARFLAFFQARVQVMTGDPAAALATLDDLKDWLQTRQDMLDDVLDVRAQAQAALGDVAGAYATMRALLDAVRGRHQQEREVQLGALETVHRTKQAQRTAQQLRDQTTALRALHDELQHLSLTDELTGLHNRRYFLQWAQQRLTEHLPVALAFVDVDHFKAVNDHAGHDGGDQVLTDVAGLLRGLDDPGTLVARLGGDEFVVARVADTPQGLAASLEGVRQQCERRAWAALSGVTVTLSIGVVMAGADLPGSLRRADEAMYTAKQAGRNRVVTGS